MKFIISYLLLFIISSGCNNDYIQKNIQKVKILSFSDPEKALALLDTLYSKNNYHDSYSRNILRLLYVHTLYQFQRTDFPVNNLIKEARFFERKGNKRFASWAYLYSSLIALRNENARNASILLTEAQENAQNLNDSTLLFNIYYNWGELYFYQNDQEAGKESYQKALSYRYALPNFPNNTSAYLIGNCLLYTQQYQKAQNIYHQIEYNLFPKDKQDSIEISRFMQNISLTYAKINRPKRAIEYIHKACYYNPTNIPSYQLSLAGIYLNNNQLDSATTYINFVKLKNLNSYRQKTRYYNYKAQLEELQGNYQEALKNKKKQLIYQDSLHIQKPEQRIENIIRYYKEKKYFKEKKILIYQRSLLILGIIIIIVLCLLSITWYSYHHKKKQLKYAEACRIITHLQNLNNEQEEFQKEFRKILQNKLENSQKLALFCSQFENRYKSFLETYRTTLGTELNWQELYFAINFLYDNFHKELTNRFPELNEKEIQVICLLRAGFHHDEIAYIIQQSIYTIHKRKTTIRKKTGIDERSDIIESLIQLLQ